MRRAASAICLAGLLGLAACGGADRPGSHPTSHPSAAAAGDGTDLTYAEIMDRCLPQLQRDWKKRFTEQPTADNVVLRNPRLPHHAGDLIGIGYRGLQNAADGVGGTYCLIPRAGHETDTVPASRLRPDPEDTQRIDELCTEADGENGVGAGLSGSGDIANVNLDRKEGPTVAATASMGSRMVVLYGGGNGSDISGAGLVCFLGRSQHQLHMVAPSERIGYTDELVGPSPGEAVYSGAGLTTPRARTIEIAPPGGRVYRVPVRQVSVATGDIPSTPFGAYAFFLRLEYPLSYYGTFPVRVLDARGTVLSTTRWDSVAMDRLDPSGPR